MSYYTCTCPFPRGTCPSCDVACFACMRAALDEARQENRVLSDQVSHLNEGCVRYERELGEARRERDALAAEASHWRKEFLSAEGYWKLTQGERDEARATATRYREALDTFAFDPTDRRRCGVCYKVLAFDMKDGRTIDLCEQRSKRIADPCRGIDARRALATPAETQEAGMLVTGNPPTCPTCGSLVLPDGTCVNCRRGTQGAGASRHNMADHVAYIDICDHPDCTRPVVQRPGEAVKAREDREAASQADDPSVGETGPHRELEVVGKRWSSKPREVMTVGTCPACGAEDGEPCKANGTHAARRVAARRGDAT